MKTPTLIIRLTGLFLLAYSINALLGIQRMENMSPGGLGLQQQIFGQIRMIAVAELLVGSTAVLFAGRLARLLTFDAD